MARDLIDARPRQLYSSSVKQNFKVEEIRKKTRFGRFYLSDECTVCTWRPGRFIFSTRILPTRRRRSCYSFEKSSLITIQSRFVVNRANLHYRWVTPGKSGRARQHDYYISLFNNICTLPTGSKSRLHFRCARPESIVLSDVIDKQY